MLFSFRYTADLEAKRVLKEKEMNRRNEQKQMPKESQRKLIRENIIASLNQDIKYTKDGIRSTDETIKQNH